MKISVSLDQSQWDALFNVVQELPFKYVAPMLPVLTEIRTQALAQIQAASAQGHDDGDAAKIIPA